MIKKKTTKKAVRHDKESDDDRSGLAIPAGLFIGLGIGFITGELVAWLFIGLGAGFIGMLFMKK